MKTLIVGLGIQGEKRKNFSGSDFKFSVDPLNRKADFKFIEQVPLSEYEAVCLCVPNNQKKKIIDYCLKNNKHVLIEKPLILDEKEIDTLQKKSIAQKTIIYVAYNHRFEPNFKALKKTLIKEDFGKLYSCRMFYGNGTARLVKNNNWKDKGTGVISDLSSHLLDTYNYFFDEFPKNFKLISSMKFENKSPDHALIMHKSNKKLIQLEVSLCMWKNSFNCDLIFENGSLHINSLCKWGPSIFTKRYRVMPSGYPKEKIKIIKMKDPTWKLEYAHFKNLIKENIITDFKKDKWISKTLKNLNG